MKEKWERQKKCVHVHVSYMHAVLLVSLDNHRTVTCPQSRVHLDNHRPVTCPLKFGHQTTRVSSFSEYLPAICYGEPLMAFKKLD